MKDEKKVNEGTKEEKVLEKRSAEKEYSGEALNEELERLAQTFRDELKKAKELSDDEFEEVYADDSGIIPKEDLCECCGERRKDKSRGAGYQYCAECRENMKIYPISFANIIVAVCLIAIAIASVVTFTVDFYGYDMMYMAQKNAREGKLNTALKYYDYAIDEFKEGDIVAKKAYLQSADIIFKTMNNGSDSMKDISERIDKALSDVEKKLPVNNSYIETQTKCKVLSSTMQHFYDIIQDEKYASYTPENKEMYTQIMTEIGSLIDEELSISATDGKTIQMVKADMGMVRFCQYMFAYMSENFEDSYKYMLETKECAPDYLWLYAYELGIAELQMGNVSEAKELASKLVENNAENADGYNLYATIERLSGNFEKSCRWAEKGLQYDQSNAELMRMKAMALICSGDYEQAKQVVDKALESNEYAALYFTAIVIETELGNEDTVKSHEKVLEEQEVALSERMKDYTSGKITAKQLFAEGTGEV